MQVNLTDKGLKVLGLKPDRRILNMPIDRAYLFMNEGLAIKDNGFMAVYAQNNPDTDKEQPKPEPEPAPKIEIAISKKAAGREKAVKR